MGSNPAGVIVLVAELVKPLFVEQEIAGSNPVKYLGKMAEWFNASVLKTEGCEKPQRFESFFSRKHLAVV